MTLGNFVLDEVVPQLHLVENQPIIFELTRREYLTAKFLFAHINERFSYSHLLSECFGGESSWEDTFARLIIKGLKKKLAFDKQYVYNITIWSEEKMAIFTSTAISKGVPPSSHVTCSINNARINKRWPLGPVKKVVEMLLNPR